MVSCQSSVSFVKVIFSSTVSYHIGINDRDEPKVMILRMMNFGRLQDLKTLTVLKLVQKGKVFHSFFKVYILMYFKCFRGRNSLLKKGGFFSFKNFHNLIDVCTMMLLPSKMSKLNNVEDSCSQIEKSNYFCSSRMMSSILGLALGS